MPVELGGSIFVEVNHMLVNAAKDYRLPVQDYRGSIRGGAEVLGVWDGQQFIFVQSDASYGWWNIVKLLWKYGMSPIRTQNLVKKTVGAFLKMYEPEHFPFESLSKKASELGLTTSTAMTGSQLLAANEINAAFAHDIVQASTRVNYAQNLDQIHGVETMVSMATDGAMSIQGGNWQIFDSMIKSSGATLHLNTSVTEITYLADSNKYALKTTTPIHDSDDTQGPTSISAHSAYDSVILAAPLQFTNITFSPPLTNPPPEIPYVSLHVTLFTSPHALSRSAFNLPPDSDVPTMILTTPNSNSSSPIPFNSITLLDILSPSPSFQNSNPAPGTMSEEQYLYKIFSLQPLNASFIANSFLEIDDEDSTGDSVDAITWMYQKRWDSYPYLPPRVTFDGTRLDEKGLWYTSGVEQFISTMETSALMGANVAELVVSSWGGAADATCAVKEEKKGKEEQVEL